MRQIQSPQHTLSRNTWEVIFNSKTELITDDDRGLTVQHEPHLVAKESNASLRRSRAAA